MNDELMHYGVLGMKWGVRRYQNKDGTLTKAGTKRYARDAREKEFNKYDQSEGKYYKQSKKNGRSDLEFDAKRYAKEDAERAKRLVEASKTLTNDLKNTNRMSMDKAKKNQKRMNLSSMSDKEMRDRINRELLERQYNDMFSPKKCQKEESLPTTFLIMQEMCLVLPALLLKLRWPLRN